MAANSSPAILPISNNQPTATTVAAATATTTATDNQQLSASSTSAVRAFLSSISGTVRAGLSQRRPWTELVDRSAFSKPESVSDATVRFRKNYNYFRTNYLVVIAGILTVSLLTNPFSLILLVGLLASWMFLYLFRQSADPPLTIFGRQFSDRETLVGLVAATIFVIFLTSVGSVLVSALMVGVAVVSLHGAFRTPEDLFLDEQEAQGASTGFLSFLSAPAVAQPPVAARV